MRVNQWSSAGDRTLDVNNNGVEFVPDNHGSYVYFPIRDHSLGQTYCFSQNTLLEEQIYDLHIINEGPRRYVIESKFPNHFSDYTVKGNIKMVLKKLLTI